MKVLYNISVLSLTLFATVAHAQDKLGTISVDIVKPYTPTIADVQKAAEETPKKDSITVAKKQVTYSSQSIPVASTFVPEKGKAVRIPVTAAKDSLYQSYVALAGGNYASIYGDAFLSIPFTATSDLSVDFTHHSSQDNVKEVETDSNFSHTQAQATYGYWGQAYQYSLSANVVHRLSHWYGVEDKTLLPISESLRQNYLTGGIAGDFSMTKGIFEGVDFFVKGTKDDFKSGEIQLKLRPSFRVAFNEGKTLYIKADVDYLQGGFDRAFASPLEITYKSAFLGIRPAYVRSSANYSLRLGMGAYYAKENNGEGGKIKVFPDIELSYNVAQKSLIPYGGITGNLEQLTYREQSFENPYLSPTQHLHPTYTPYDIFAGIRGALFQGFSYDLKAFYTRIEQMPMYQANEKYTLADRKPYQYDNSYSIIYQDAMSFGAKATIRGKFSDSFYIDAFAKINTYSFDSLKAQERNLPLFTSALSASYSILPQWNVGTSFYYVGERKDIKHSLPALTAEELTLDGFFDLNFSTDYTFLKRWTAFVDLSNVLGQNYQRWTSYPVQGFQFLVGVKYRFNVK